MGCSRRRWISGRGGALALLALAACEAEPEGPAPCVAAAACRTAEGFTGARACEGGVLGPCVRRVDAAQPVGPEGALLDFGPVWLDVPRGALGTAVTLLVEPARSGAPAPPVAATSPVLRFEPEGLRFGVPLVVSFPVPSSAEGEAVIYWTTPDGARFEARPTRRVGGRAEASVDHFSRGFLAVAASPDAGVEDAGPEDAGSDAGPDLGPTDAGPADSGPTDIGPTDANPADSGPTDLGPTDAGPADADPADIGPTDAGPADSGPTDIGPIDAAPADIGPTDAGAVDAGPADIGPTDAGAVDAGPADIGPTDAGAIDADIGSSDLGLIDAGSTDASPADIGAADASPADIGAADAGAPDLGPTDAGPTDAGPLPPLTVVTSSIPASDPCVAQRQRLRASRTGALEWSPITDINRLQQLLGGPVLFPLSATLGTGGLLEVGPIYRFSGGMAGFGAQVRDPRDGATADAAWWTIMRGMATYAVGQGGRPVVFDRTRLPDVSKSASSGYAVSVAPAPASAHPCPNVRFQRSNSPCSGGRNDLGLLQLDQQGEITLFSALLPQLPTGTYCATIEALQGSAPIVLQRSTLLFDIVP